MEITIISSCWFLLFLNLDIDFQFLIDIKDSFTHFLEIEGLEFEDKTY